MGSGRQYPIISKSGDGPEAGRIGVQYRPGPFPVGFPGGRQGSYPGPFPGRLPGARARTVRRPSRPVSRTRKAAGSPPPLAAGPGSYPGPAAHGSLKLADSKLPRPGTTPSARLPTPIGRHVQEMLSDSRSRQLGSPLGTGTPLPVRAGRLPRPSPPASRLFQCGLGDPPQKTSLARATHPQRSEAVDGPSKSGQARPELGLRPSILVASSPRTAG